jgi:DNA polymerase-3 subunit alpha
MKIIKKEYLGIQPVYDISVDSKHHDFKLENGLIASNCFNKAHSVSYSVLTYVTAYLKANYPVEFFTALMSTRSKTLQPKTWAIKAPEYINEAKHFNVDIFPPDINRSGFEFTIHDNEIYFGLNAIRDVGSTAAKFIIQARHNTPFKDIWDFINRVNTQKVNTKVFEALVKAGAFDKLGYIRSELLENVSSIYNYTNDMLEYNQRLIDIKERDEENSRVLPQIERRNFLRKEVIKLEKKIIKTPTEDLLTSLHLYKQELETLESLELKKQVDLKEKQIPVKPEFQRNKKVELTIEDIVMQASYIGCYIGGHPITFTTIQREDLDTVEENMYCKVAGVVLSVRNINTKAGKKMAILEIDDSTKAAEVVIFPNNYQKFEELDIKTGDIILVNAKVDEIEPDLKLIANSFSKHIWEKDNDEQKFIDME